ncbi:methyltransferase domain-containing protein [Lolliginicoccus suaedae]|uniref:methyltransferase domain-containing protein n=1 Tax=Lolliginicoccus suaedae TaxID=2605429 RepID=UPI0011EBB2CB|nr:methyltransferase domain-containing protein [Lolliginicoccus suaedae]
MDLADRGQVRASAAEIYDRFFVPALFGAWPSQVLDAADVKMGDRVADVGCGTGIVAVEAARRVGPSGTVTGIDPNAGMLAVARAKDPSIHWIAALAEELPLEDGSVDALTCQFAMMFFTDQPRALTEFARVLRPGGRAAIATWAALDATPGYAVMVDLLRELFGERHARALAAPYSLGDARQLTELISQEFADVAVEQLLGRARFPSIEAWVHTDVRGWTLADMIDDAQYQQLLEAARTRLARFTDARGAVTFDAPALIATATRA